MGRSGGLTGGGPSTARVKRRMARAVRRQSGMVRPVWSSGGNGRLCPGAGRFLFLLLTRIAHGVVGLDIGEQRCQQGCVDPGFGELWVFGPQLLKPDQRLHAPEGELEPPVEPEGRLRPSTAEADLPPGGPAVGAAGPHASGRSPPGPPPARAARSAPPRPHHPPPASSWGQSIIQLHPRQQLKLARMGSGSGQAPPFHT